MIKEIIIRPEKEIEFEIIDEMVKRSFREGIKSDGIDEMELVHEIRASKYYIPELSFVAMKGDVIVGHFMFSYFPLSKEKNLGNYDKEIIVTPTVLLAPVAVNADYFRQGIGSIMLNLGIEQVKKRGYIGIQVEGNPKFYNKLGFITSSNYGIYPTTGYPMQHPECLMVQETYEGSLKDIHGYVDYSMYEHA
ncbi:GNAT family N-acetyltransferase [Clostridium sp. Marseille-P299]|uniref:GNAT family N-acetyltransferase n=1 Tax=Clostridium sp. Marseille-P299 TaxID=1805477 RepID=UPI00082CD87B|nr:N-acetyltransferase [Clostridium sp. Marseille-P299]